MPLPCHVECIDPAVARYPSSGVSYSFGPGGITPAVKLLLIANVASCLLNLIVAT